MFLIPGKSHSWDSKHKSLDSLDICCKAC